MGKKDKSYNNYLNTMTCVSKAGVFIQVYSEWKTGRIILQMNVVVEFIGVSRILSGVSEVNLSIPGNGTYRDVIHELSKKFPQFNDQLIDIHQNCFIGSSMFNIDGKRMIKSAELDDRADENGHLILMSVLAGG
jgi:hypothetical protein